VTLPQSLQNKTKLWELWREGIPIKPQQKKTS